MRFGLIDFLFLTTSLFAGMMIGVNFSLRGPTLIAAGLSTGLGIYLFLVYPFYRMLRLFPMILPRCPCCNSFQPGFHTLAAESPRILCQCPGCNGEFVIWINGNAGDNEDWSRPVLALRWPYAFGRYRRLTKPEPVLSPDQSQTPSGIK